MWGLEDWGELVWSGAAAVPLTSPLGLVVLVCALLCGATLAMRSRWPRYLPWFAAAVLVVVPITAYATVISMPHTFSNGTVADATQVNANFDVLVAESNLQDARIAALESLVATLQSDVSGNSAAIGANQSSVGTNGASIAALQGDVAANGANVATLQGNVATNGASIAAAQVGVSINAVGIATLQQKTQYVTVSGNEMYITQANLNIRSGQGSTSGAVNGLGNLIVGYNENQFGGLRTGSHNLVVGWDHGYSSYAGMVIGRRNTIQGVASSVSGGNNNATTVDANYASVSGGIFNTANANYASISGGANNNADGTRSSISGGSYNTTVANLSSILGGWDNTTNGGGSSIAGGRHNLAESFDAAVAGGESSTAGGVASTVCGGLSSVASTAHSAALGPVAELTLSAP